MENVFYLRSRVVGFLYRGILKKVLFLFDPELMHFSFIKIGRILGKKRITKKITSLAFNFQDKEIEQEILGIKFRNPVGLSAGFDKNGEAISIMEDVGFGFVEAGSITAKASLGNQGKRLQRLPEKKSLWVYFGLNNKGAEANYERIKNENFKIPFGVSVARTNSKETVSVDAGVKDYLFTLQTFRERTDFFVINISCPNSFGAEQFSEPERYNLLLKEIKKLKLKQPVFVKLSPDLDKKQVDKIIDISKKYKISGFVCTNLTKQHGFSKGGLSGKAVEKKSNEMLSYVFRKSREKKAKFVIIGVGGIFSAEDAYRKIKLGANLVELVTGMIYNGPGVIGEINFGIKELMKKEGYKRIADIVGIDSKIAKHI